jgi:hypothetical protein
LQRVEAPFKRLFAERSGKDDEGNAQPSNGFRKRYGFITVIDSMANNDPTKWAYFERMNVVNFLQMVMYYHDKQEDLRERAEQQRMEMELKNGVHR